MQNSLKNKDISIAGSGVAGLVSALMLKKKGFNPVLYEKSSQCGYNRHGDFEGLESWNLNSDPISYLNSLGIKSTFRYRSFSSFDVHIPGKKSINIDSPEPFFYIVSRGDQMGDLDYELQRQVQDKNIKIHFNTKIDKDNADIIATGSKNIKAYIRGAIFDTELKDQIHLILGNKIAPYGYGYVIIVDGRCTIAVAYKQKEKKCKDIFKKLRQFVNDKIGIEIENYKEFASYGSFNFQNSKIDSDGRMYIGEAGGFQDYLFGFGIQYAVESAVLSAESYQKNISFDRLWKRKLRAYMKVAYRNRMFFESLNDHFFYKACQILSRSDNPVDLLRNRSKPGILDKVLNFI